MPINLHTEIFNFLETGLIDYLYGVSLLSYVCKNKTLISNLQRKESPNNKAKLAYELDKFLTLNNRVNESKEEEHQNNTIQTETVISRASVESTITHKQEANSQKRNNSFIKRTPVDNSRITHDLLVVIEQLKTDRNKYYAERASYHGQLHGARTKNERYELAKLIMPIQKEIDIYNNQLAEILETGQLPQNGDHSSLTVKQHKRLQNLKIYIRRYNNKAKNTTDLLDKEKHLSKVKSFETELNEILSLNE